VGLSPSPVSENAEQVTRQEPAFPDDRLIMPWFQSDWVASPNMGRQGVMLVTTQGTSLRRLSQVW
jgi:hypothetical protein